MDISYIRGPLLTCTLQDQVQERGTIPETLRRIPPPENGTQQYHVFPPTGQAPSTSQPNLVPGVPSPQPPLSGAQSK
jgi:hypothetical protein